jgi:uncharacterized protein
MPNFVNRERELSALRRACADHPGLVVVSGRRRVGKTAMLDHFAGSWAELTQHPEAAAVFLPGTRTPISETLRRLEERLRSVLPPVPGDILDLGHLETWDATLGYLLARSRQQPLLLVLDEFPYLCETDPSLPSTLQARWDHRGDTQLSVVLAGSHVGLMEELVAADAPLFGRADAHLRLNPFSWREAPLLVDGDEEAVLEAQLTVGGMPRYLGLWDGRHDALTNLAELLDGPGAPLGDEGTVVLQELAPTSAAARILELVALGAGTFGAIRERTGLAPATTSEALNTLEGLGLLDRLTPVGEDPRRTRRVRYEVRDPLLRLWLGLVQPHREAFELGRGANVLAANRERIAASQQQALAGVARDWLGAREGASCGPWWATGDDAPVDALALRGTTPTAAAGAWWATGVDGDEQRGRLRKMLADSPYDPDVLEIVARDGTAVTTPADLYADA